MDKRWRRGLAGALLLLVLYAGAALWPAAVGGSMDYVTTHGSSMEPKIHQGDLALVRRSNDYAVGDVVAYRSTTLKGVTVLHRIIGRKGGTYAFQGDNNDFVDPDHPTESELIGKLWVHVPKGGRVLGSLRLVLPLLLAGIGLLSTAAATARRRHRARPAHLGIRPAAPSSVRSWRSATVGLGATAGVCLLLGLVSFSRPTSQSSREPVRYTQTGAFTYSATAPAGAVYADGQVRTGDPVFRRLVDQLDVTFEYDVGTTASRTLAGTIAVRTEVRSGSGWHRTLDTLPAKAFSGDRTSTTVHLDLNRLESMVKEVESITGVEAGTTTVAILPEAKVVGTLGDQRIQQTFAPALDFQLQPLQLKLTDPDTQLTSTKAGTLQHTTDVPRQLQAFGLAAPVATVRLLSLGLGLPAILGAGAGLVAMRRRLKDEADHIELRHGHRMVPVSAATTKNVIEVTSMQDLARLAEQYQALILHRQGQRGHDYLLQADGVVYRYQTKSRVLG